MRCTIVFLLGLFLLFNTIRPARTCHRRRRPSRPPSPNRPPEFSADCFRTIVVAAGPGKTGAQVSWPPDKVRATDPDSAQQAAVSLVTAQGNGSYFSGVSGEHTVIYKAHDSKNGVSYCQFKVIVTVKYCPSVHPILYGRHRCTEVETNVYGSRCTTECNTGYELSSSSQRTVECLNNSGWSNSFPTCEPVNCGPPGTVQNGQVQCYPACGYMYPTTCSVKCEAGYKYGLNWTLISCKKDGTWDPLYSCLDGQAPKFPNDCPQDLTLNSGPLGSKVVVSWTDPETSDNSGQGVTLTSSPAKGASLPPGTHTVTIRATDAAGNWDNCRFQVDIKLWTCPPLQIHQGRATCDEGFMVGSHCSVTCNEGYRIQDSAAAVTCINSSSSSSSSSQDEAVWSSPDTSCEPVMCPEVPLDHGTYICPNGRTYTKLCFPKCDQGFSYDGISFIQCYANGSWAKLGSCKVECPVGSMEQDEVCVQCPLGFYQDQPASTTCKPCPPGKTWELPGAVSLLQCVYPLEMATTGTQQPPLTTPDNDDNEMDTGVLLGVLFGVLALLVIILITVCFIYKHISQQQRTSQRGSWLSLNRVLTSDPVRTVSPMTDPLPYYEENAPPSYQQSIEKGRDSLYHATAATSFTATASFVKDDEEIPKD